MTKGWMLLAALLSAGMRGWGQAPVEKPGGRIDLPTSKEIHGVVPGAPKPLDSLPVTMAVSPDGLYVVTVNGGYGSYESGYHQSLAVMDTQTGKVEDFPDARTLVNAKQALFSGLAFSSDGRTLYGSLVSMSDPTGKTKDDTGSGIEVYGFQEGKITRERMIQIAPPQLASGRTTLLVGASSPGEAFGAGTPGADHTKGLPYPAAIAVVPQEAQNRTPPGQPGTPGVGGDRLLVAGNLSDDVWLIDAATGRIETRFDLSETNVVPSVYPVALAVAKDSRKAYVALWNGSEVVELDLFKGTVGRKLPLLKNDDPVRPGSHPDALALAPDGKTLYAALGNRDVVAALDLSSGGFKLKGYFDVRLPGQSFFGAEPEALAVNADGSRVYVANMGSDAVAVLDTHKLTRSAAGKGMVEPMGFVPTEWLPTGVALSSGKLYVATGKGTGTGPNNFPQKPTSETTGPRFKLPFSYIATLLHGSIAQVDLATAEKDLKETTAAVMLDNRMKAAAERIAWDPTVMTKKSGAATQVSAATPETPGTTGGASGPIKHVIYIIRENRTYDQLLGDFKVDGKAVGNGDPSLVMYGDDVTPNLHKLVKQFGVLDNFYDSAEVSGDGHVWSNSAIGTDYLERTWQLNYRGGQHGYDFEGVVSQGLPLEQHIPDVNEPSSGYIWGNLARHGMTLYHFGEFISTTFCNPKRGAGAQLDSRQGPMLEGVPCSQRNEVKPGEALPAVWGGGVNRWPWTIPLIEANKPTKPELVGHFAVEAPDFNLRIPDQIRENVFEKHLAGWIADKKTGKDTMPNFVMLRLANDHTAGTTPGGPTPKSSVADNDLAVGRAVEAISQSPFWEDTAFFILEDDAQNGADHVDAHRSIGVVVSKYAPHGEGGMPFVDSRFYSTVSMVRTMEMVLGLPPMNNNDALSSAMGSLFTGPGDQASFTADRSNETNRLIYTANPPAARSAHAGAARGAHESSKMDFSHADRADAEKLNLILWQDAHPDAPTPVQLTTKRKKQKKEDDGDE